MSQAIRQHAEQAFEAEIEALKQVDTYPKPPNWQLSPWAVLQYLMGGTLENGFELEPKYIGNSRVIEIAIATLATDRALLLLGVPGTAKTWVAEHLTAAISGDSTLLVQGTAGTPEEAIRYSWNYAQLLSKGPNREALVPSPIMRAMELGKIGRVEELTRLPADVQDTLITLLSEKMLPIPELEDEVMAQQGFNLIATANDRDKGVNDLSSALRRRFNTVILPLPATLEEEVDIVSTRVSSIGKMLQLPTEAPAVDEIKRLVTIFRELRGGKSLDGSTRLKSPSSTLSTAEAISVAIQGISLASHFGDGTLKAKDLAGGLVGAIVKEPDADQMVLKEYLETVVKERGDWKDLYRAVKEIL
ncbi:AAA family ATPase [Pontibacter sp. G13]|uniref:ATP-binding protein n=1 Tax=Pontibacter sp. G13 TaxID=3074898 RepID=UPI0028892435|nr:AAA family ATPase [Pontibacter sp. G13]WNJ19719.1 AAA family ATPase [Pontibacter sp. G13]